MLDEEQECWYDWHRVDTEVLMDNKTYRVLSEKTVGCLPGYLVSSARIQKLFCGIYSAFKCSFNEFVGEEVVSPSYFSAILS